MSQNIHKTLRELWAGDGDWRGGVDCEGGAAEEDGGCGRLAFLYDDVWFTPAGVDESDAKAVSRARHIATTSWSEALSGRAKSC